jgi:hypothetical protein
MFLELHSLDITFAIRTLISARTTGNNVGLEEFISEFDFAEEALGFGMLFFNVFVEFGFVDDFGTLGAFHHVLLAEDFVDDESLFWDQFCAVDAGGALLHYCIFWKSG